MIVMRRIFEQGPQGVPCERIGSWQCSHARLIQAWREHLRRDITWASSVALVNQNHEWVSLRHSKYGPGNTRNREKQGGHQDGSRNTLKKLMRGTRREARKSLSTIPQNCFGFPRSQDCENECTCMVFCLPFVVSLACWAFATR